MNQDHTERMERVSLCLEGLWTGDCFGQQFFHPLAPMLLENRAEPKPPWPHTDDTEMALSIAQTLRMHRRIDQDQLAEAFATRYRNDPCRGYGATAHLILQQIVAGTPWREAASQAFEGQGSMGNGAAMRVAPVGAYFAEDYEAVAREARASAEVTHAHPEGIAGAIAVALAAAWVWNHRTDAGNDFFPTILEYTPASATRRGIEHASILDSDLSAITAASLLGNGKRITSQDTVPFALWSAWRHRANFVESLWNTAAVLGDIDTNCAIVGSIVVLGTGLEAIPRAWQNARN